MYHSHLRMVWLEGSDKAQLMMGNSGYTVTWCPRRCSDSTNARWHVRSHFWMMHSSLLQMAWPGYRHLPETTWWFSPWSLPDTPMAVLLIADTLVPQRLLDWMVREAKLITPQPEPATETYCYGSHWKRAAFFTTQDRSQSYSILKFWIPTKQHTEAGVLPWRRNTDEWVRWKVLFFTVKEQF